MNKIALICMFLLSLNYVDCKVPAIINGTVAESDEALYYVEIELQGEHNCGGTLIAGNKVLTAAHCVDDVPVNLTSVKIGSKIFQDKQIKSIKALKMVKHPKYRAIIPPGTLAINDVAVITLSENVQETATIRYAKLQNRPIPVNEKVTVYGLGRKNTLNIAPAIYPVVLMKAKLTVEKRQENRLHCRSTTQQACSGDSGGPLVSSDGKVCGIAASIEGDCSPGFEAHFSEVAPYINWIRAQ